MPARSKAENLICVASQFVFSVRTSGLRRPSHRIFVVTTQNRKLPRRKVIEISQRKEIGYRAVLLRGADLCTLITY